MKQALVLSTQATAFDAATLQGSVEANLDTLAAIGYDGVELAVRDPSLVDGGEIRRLTEVRGLEVPAIGTGQAWGEDGLSFTHADEAVRRAATERVRSHIDLASELNALVVIGLVRGVHWKSVSQEQAERWLVEALTPLAQCAEEAGVGVAVEAINRYETSLVNSASEGLALIDQVGSPALGLLLDTFHMNIEEADMRASISQTGKRLFHFHVADSNRWYPGAGHIDFKRLLSVLQRTGYTGYVSGEFLPRPDAETAARKSFAYISSLS
ncbi:MAG: TIM barrel protein [Spirochaetes bacterium]|jgi:sugar phosphate isomerase/epimerase|nr:TIM barrel protein [Spirochaetota bacterium]